MDQGARNIQPNCWGMIGTNTGIGDWIRSPCLRRRKSRNVSRGGVPWLTLLSALTSDYHPEDFAVFAMVKDEAFYSGLPLLTKLQTLCVCCLPAETTLHKLPQIT